MVWPLVLERLTVKGMAVVPRGGLLVVPSGLTSSSMESTAAASSFWIVPVPLALRFTLFPYTTLFRSKVSSGSNAVSAHTSTVTGLLVSPGAKVSVPLWLMWRGLVRLLLAVLVFTIAPTLHVA